MLWENIVAQVQVQAIASPSNRKSKQSQSDHLDAMAWNAPLGGGSIASRKIVPGGRQCIATGSITTQSDAFRAGVGDERSETRRLGEQIKSIVKPALEAALQAFGNGIEKELTTLRKRLESVEKPNEVNDMRAKVIHSKGVNDRDLDTVDQSVHKTREAAPSGAAACNACASVTRTRARRERRKRMIGKRYERERLLCIRLAAVNSDQYRKDDEGSKDSCTDTVHVRELVESVSLRIANLEAVVVACCVTSVGANLQQPSFEENAAHDRHVEWGEFQCALPAALLEQQCSAARRMQGWWRRVRLRRNVTTTRTQSLNDEGNPLAFLTLADLANLHACSFAHTSCLCEMGYGPQEGCHINPVAVDVSSSYGTESSGETESEPNGP